MFEILQQSFSGKALVVLRSVGVEDVIQNEDTNHEMEAQAKIRATHKFGTSGTSKWNGNKADVAT